ncbi:hypothetical protein [Bordetella genomosp. 5]|uniref:Pilus assembly protein TadE n=1 Tax=Bordetella genomosp. 5 TaxID=1395608 RepID=A0A261TY81_9BORD|nr:hypothetical protein [Bordetella genomosp. 5]OZI54589.1 hypothetical protein CAL25_05010 [Bordetella genomosp. 5]
MPAHLPGRQRGAALIESALAVLALTALATALIEASHWRQLQHALYAALTQAARAGATAHADPAIIARSFEAALPGRVRAAQGSAGRDPRVPGWRIDIQRPDARAYATHAEQGLPVPRAAAGLPAIRNDYQAEQHAARPTARPDIFEANQLQLRLTYPVRPLAPWTGALLRAIASSARDSCVRGALAAGRLPLRLTLEIDMQSHPVRYADQPPVWVRTPTCPP